MSSNTRGRKIVLIVVSIFVALIVILGILEALVRSSAASNIREEIGTNATGEEAQVSFGSTPLLLSLITGNISRVEINTPSTVQITYPDNQDYPEVTGTPKSHIVATDLDTRSDPAYAGSLRLETTINNDFIKAELHSQFAQALAADTTTVEEEDDFSALANSYLQSIIEVTSVSTDAAAGTMTIEFNNGLATVTLSPSVEGGQLTFNDVQSTVLGLDLPTEVNSALAASINSAIQLEEQGLSFESTEVQDNGLFVVISGTNVPMQDLEVSA